MMLNGKSVFLRSLESIEKLQFKHIRTSLLPVLKKGTFYDLEGVKQCVIEYLKDMMQLTDNERQFIACFNVKEYRPEFLFDDAEIVERIRNHPMAKWKTQE